MSSSSDVRKQRQAEAAKAKRAAAALAEDREPGVRSGRKRKAAPEPPPPPPPPPPPQSWQDEWDDADDLAQQPGETTSEWHRRRIMLINRRYFTIEPRINAPGSAEDEMLWTHTDRLHAHGFVSSTDAARHYLEVERRNDTVTGHVRRWSV